MKLAWVRTNISPLVVIVVVAVACSGDGSADEVDTGSSTSRDSTVATTDDSSTTTDSSAETEPPTTAAHSTTTSAPGPATDRLVFDQYLGVHQCLRDGGFETSDPPLTYESWVKGGEVWNPWAGFSPEDHTIMEQALLACPL